MDKYLYFRKATTAATEDDDATGSTVYPLSAFQGMCSGTAAAGGAVTDDADAFSMFFAPKGVAVAGSGDADDAGADHTDIVVVAITTDNNQKAVMKAIIEELYYGKSPMIEIFDGGAGSTSSKLHSDIEDITILHQTTAD